MSSMMYKIPPFEVEQQRFALAKDGMGLEDYISGLSSWSKTVYFQGALAVKCPRCKCVYFVKRELSNMFFPKKTIVAMYTAYIFGRGIRFLNVVFEKKAFLIHHPKHIGEL